MTQKTELPPQDIDRDAMRAICTQSLTQMYTAPTAIVMVLIISIQLLIGTSLFL